MRHPDLCTRNLPSFVYSRCILGPQVNAELVLAGSRLSIKCYAGGHQNPRTESEQRSEQSFQQRGLPEGNGDIVGRIGSNLRFV